MSRFDIQCEDLTDMAALRAQWLDLQQRADGSFFTSWHWIGSWLALAQPGRLPLKVLRVYGDGELLALAVFNWHTTHRHHYLSSRQLSLHQYDQPGLDMMIEYNDVLIDRRYRSSLPDAILDYLATAALDWEELRLSGVSADHPFLTPEIIERLGLRLRLDGASLARSVDLNNIRQQGGDYLASLSRKRRYQIRQSVAAYERLGQLKLDVADSLERAREYFAALGELHQDYWNSRGKAGSFANPVWLRFHQMVIDEGFDSGAIQLCRIAAGEQVVGYLYNLLWRGRVAVLQTGFAYSADKAKQPGYISHYLAIEHNLLLGNDSYDFLAGKALYKDILANRHDTLLWVRLQRPSLKFSLEEALRRARRRLKGYSDDVAF